MRGFLVGAVFLIGLELLLQPSSASGVKLGGSVISTVAQRLLSPQVAGLPDFSKGGASPYAAVPSGENPPVAPAGENAPALDAASQPGMGG